uniref:RasGEF domain family member 1C n=1 Tax=Chinchilla lanigera TaxID=34839 RepID=A0A8C2VIY5_CHILA
MPQILSLPPREPGDGEQAGQPLLASLGTLIQHLEPTANYYPWWVSRQRKFGSRLLRLLAKWMETFPRDFQEESATGHLKDVEGHITPCDEAGKRSRIPSPHTLPPRAPTPTSAAGRKEPCFSDKTDNLEAYVKWFNRLCYPVATESCVPAKKKQRAQAMEFFIGVARECFSIGKSLMAISCDWHEHDPVSRLKKTWAKVKTAEFFILEHQMEPTGNFCNYRTALRGAAHRSLAAHSSQEKIVIPFFSLLIKDICFLNEGCANRLPNGHIHFEAGPEGLAGDSGQVRCTTGPCGQPPCLISLPICVGLFLASYESESPENHTEKERGGNR